MNEEISSRDVKDDIPRPSSPAVAERQVLVLAHFTSIQQGARRHLTSVYPE